MLGGLPEQWDDPDILIGYDTSDDAAAVRLNSAEQNQVLLQSVDFISPIVDDPFICGQIAAANSLYDICAMGGRHRFALNVVGFPKNDLPLLLLKQN